MRSCLAACLLVLPALSAGASLADAEAALRAYEAKAEEVESQQFTGNVEGLQALLDEKQALARAAQQAYRDAGAAHAQDIEVLRAYATTLRATGDHDLAAEALGRAVVLAPDDAALWREYGADLGAVGPAKRRAAFDALRESLRLDSASPEAAEAHFLRGKLFHQEGLFDLAGADYAAALTLDSSHIAAQIGKAILDARNGSVVEAARTLDTLGLAAQPYDAWTRVELREALYQYERLNIFFEDSAANHSAYARLLYRAARVTDAILAARHAVTLDPSDYETWNLIASMQLQIGTPQRAREAYEKSIAINPDQPRVRAMLEQLPQE